MKSCQRELAPLWEQLWEELVSLWEERRFIMGGKEDCSREFFGMAAWRWFAETFLRL